MADEPLLEGEFGGPPSPDPRGGPRFHLRLTRTALHIQGGDHDNLGYRDNHGDYCDSGPAAVLRLADVVGAQLLKPSGTPPHAAFFAIFAYPARGGGSRSRGEARGGSRCRWAPTFCVDAAPDYGQNRETAERWARVIGLLVSGEATALDPRNGLPPEPRRRRLLLLLNPFGGRGRALRLCQSHVLPMICEAGISFNLVQTERPNHARDLVSGLGLAGWDGIVTVSGDGLVYEVLNGLLARPDWALALQVPLGVLPCGTGNALAAAINCHAGLSPALGVSLLQNCSLLLCHGSPCPLDVLAVTLPSGGRVFSALAVAWGLVAEADVGSERLRRLGPVRFLLTAAARVLRLCARPARLAYLPATGLDTGVTTAMDTRTDCPDVGMDWPDIGIEPAETGVDPLDARTQPDTRTYQPATGVDTGVDTRMDWLDTGTEPTEIGVDPLDTRTHPDARTHRPATGVDRLDIRMDQLDTGTQPDTWTQLDSRTQPDAWPPLPRSATSVTCSTWGVTCGDSPGDPDLSRAMSDPGLCDSPRGDGLGDRDSLGDRDILGHGDIPGCGDTPSSKNSPGDSATPSLEDTPSNEVTPTNGDTPGATLRLGDTLRNGDTPSLDATPKPRPPPGDNANATPKPPCPQHPQYGPVDDLLVPLGQPLPPGWVTLEGDFVLVVALSPSHLGAGLVAAPGARPDDGLVHLLWVRAGATRGALLRALLAMARGGDPGDSPGTPLSRVPARAFRLEPLGRGGAMTVDGERVECGPVQGQLHPGLARVIGGHGDTGDS